MKVLIWKGKLSAFVLRTAAFSFQGTAAFQSLAEGVILSTWADYCLADYCLDNGYQLKSHQNILQYIVAFIATMMCVYCGTPKN
ncbi:hypothetical protein L2E82_45573 [Cichorium intybus]|uniref:Uncharacterized protein n=1 Tax=Cichorium intybus TaxID=13427 RepID=A0ACB8ZTP7_CICIN|nr:hypothetical protein L2E82_45573 [Cichorium intybus]